MIFLYIMLYIDLLIICVLIIFFFKILFNVFILHNSFLCYNTRSLYCSSLFFSLNLYELAYILKFKDNRFKMIFIYFNYIFDNWARFYFEMVARIEAISIFSFCSWLFWGSTFSLLFAAISSVLRCFNNQVLRCVLTLCLSAPIVLQIKSISRKWDSLSIWLLDTMNSVLVDCLKKRFVLFWTPVLSFLFEISKFRMRTYLFLFFSCWRYYGAWNRSSVFLLNFKEVNQFVKCKRSDYLVSWKSLCSMHFWESKIQIQFFDRFQPIPLDFAQSCSDIVRTETLFEIPW